MSTPTRRRAPSPASTSRRNQPRTTPSNPPAGLRTPHRAPLVTEPTKSRGTSPRRSPQTTPKATPRRNSSAPGEARQVPRRHPTPKPNPTRKPRVGAVRVALAQPAELPSDSDPADNLGVGDDTFRALCELEEREIGPEDYDLLSRLHAKASLKTLSPQEVDERAPKFTLDADSSECLVCMSVMCKRAGAAASMRCQPPVPRRVHRHVADNIFDVLPGGSTRSLQTLEYRRDAGSMPSICGSICVGVVSPLHCYNCLRANP